MSENLIIGSSHAVPLAQAVGQIPATPAGLEGDIVALGSAGDQQNYLIFTHNKPHFLVFREGQDRKTVAQFSPFIEKVRSFNREDCKVIFYIGGNEHNIMFLRAHPKPFDFVHSSSGSVLAGRQIIPLPVMRGILRTALERTFLVTRLISDQLPLAQRFYVAPPPPIGSDAHIRGNPEVFDFSVNEIEPASVRMKIYQLYLELVAAFCADAGLAYLPPRLEHCDERGFLDEPFWSGCTHATVDYYRGLVAELGL